MSDETKPEPGSIAAFRADHQDALQAFYGRKIGSISDLDVAAFAVAKANERAEAGRKKSKG